MKYALFIFFALAAPNFGFAGNPPYETETTKDLIISGGAIGLGVAGYFLNESLPPLSQIEIDALVIEDVNPFDRGACYKYSESAATASDVLLYTCQALPLFLLIDKDIRGDALPLGIMYFETTLLNLSVTMLVKTIAKRPRPFNYNPGSPSEIKFTRNARRSFFSGHTSSAFAASVFFSGLVDSYFPDSGWRYASWGGSLALAAATGYLRYEAGAHFPTDIIIGAIAGGAIGYIIPKIHETKSQAGPAPESFRPVYLGFNIAI